MEHMIMLLGILEVFDDPQGERNGSRCGGYST
jgi:hypothetical protein